MNPALVVGSKSAGGNQAVYMRMQEQVLPPRMQDADEANPGPQSLYVISVGIQDAISTPEKHKSEMATRLSGSVNAVKFVEVGEYG